MKKVFIILLLASCSKEVVKPKMKVELFTEFKPTIVTDGRLVRNEVRTQIILDCTYVEVSKAGNGYYLSDRGQARFKDQIVIK